MQEIIELISKYGVSLVIVGLFLYKEFKKDKIEEKELSA